jgi:hypothetical protein
MATLLERAGKAARLPDSPFPPTLAPSGGRTRAATDLVPLGRTGGRICRLGMGTGSDSGKIQRELGQSGFDRLVRYAYDRGIRFIDTAEGYATHGFVRHAIRSLPRETLWIQTKMPWDSPAPPEKPLDRLHRYLKELGTDYVDSLLIHCATKASWPEDLRGMMDAFSVAQERGLIRLKGVSCHGLPALRRATGVDWVEVHLARVNPQGVHVDGASGQWSEPGAVPDAMRELEEMHAKGRGVIGMKIIGDGEFSEAVDRERSVRFSMQCGFVDAIVIGFAGTGQIDEAIERMNRALNEPH